MVWLLDPSPNTYTIYITTKTTNNELNNPVEPTTTVRAISNPEWLAAMKTEYDAFITDNTQTLVPQTVDMHLVDCKWVFRVKYNINRTVQKYKAKLVVKGFQQTLSVDYFEAFTLLVKATTIRVMLS